MGDLRSAAAQYVRHGYWVLPLYGIAEEGHCLCGKRDCSSAGKHPLTPLAPHAIHSATRDESKVHEWWGEHPRANIGIATGKTSGMVVLDIDPRHGGNFSLEELEAIIDLPPTVTAQTGSGGAHLIYAYPVGVEVKSRSGGLGDGIDIKAKGGYIVAPPSRHVSGGEYRWEDASSPYDMAPAELPPKLLERLTEYREPPVGSGDPITKNRNSRLLAIGGAMRRKGAEQASIAAALHMENSARCIPMLSAAEVEKIARNCMRYDPADPLLDHPDRLLELFLSGSGAGPGYCLSFTEYMGDAEPQPEEEDWWVSGIVPKGSAMVIGGPPKSAKSITTLDLAVAMASGKDWLGQIDTKQAKVLYLSLEDSQVTTQRRLWQLLRGYGLHPKELEGRLAVDTAHGFFFEQKRYQLALQKAIEQMEPDVVLIDSLARSMSGNENSKEELARVTQPWAEMVREYGITIGVIHHFKKASKELDGSPIPLGYRLRGSGDLFAFVRHVVGLEKIPELRRTSRIEVDGNYAVDLEPFALATETELTQSGQILRLVHKGDPDRLEHDSIEERIVILLQGRPRHTEELAKELRKAKKTLIPVLNEMESDGRIYRAGPRAPWKAGLYE